MIKDLLSIGTESNPDGLRLSREPARQINRAEMLHQVHRHGSLYRQMPYPASRGINPATWLAPRPIS